MAGRFVRSACTAALLASAVLAVPSPAAGAVPAAPGEPRDPSVTELLKRMRTLYQQAEVATESYNAVEERLRLQRTRARELGADLATARARLTHNRREVGRLARAQYQDGSGLAPYAALLSLLGDSSASTVDKEHGIRRAADLRLAAAERLTLDEKRAARLAKRARGALRKQTSLAAQRKERRDRVKKRLAHIERTLASLSGTELDELRRLEREDIDHAQRRLLSTGALGPPGAVAAPSTAGTPSEYGDRALRYAYEQIGKPYAWGADGPDSFDCSGLTSQAWAHAGKPIPRTSQQQWKRLPRVKTDELRPGDLVVYFKSASHVALYAGDGMVVQAPRPGTRVKISPIAANPLLGAVRPDAGEPAMTDYVPPRPPD